MSKYIKLEDAIHNINLEVIGRKEYTGDMKANLFFALDDLPTMEVNVEVSEDAISRAGFIEMIKGTIADATIHGISPRLDPHFVISMVKSAPSVIPKEKAGEWIDAGIGKDEVYDEMYVCSECGSVEFYSNYCPNCGTMMKGADDE